MIDEAFLPFRGLIEQMLSFGGEFVDEAEGVRSYIYECEIDSPVELDVVQTAGGGLQIGTVPPLYYVDTTFRPSYHKLRFTVRLQQDPAQLQQDSDGD
jgi:hypothetical protein